MGTRAVRAWRGTAAAVFATFVAALSHSAALGAPAPMLGVILALTVATPVCVLLAGRRTSWMRLSLAVVISQVVFHGLLSIGVGEGGGQGAVALPGGHLHSAALGEIMMSAGDLHSMAGHAGVGMWYAHVVAAVITVVAFGKGEHAIRALLDLAGWRLVARAVVAVPAPRRPRLTLGFSRVNDGPAPSLLSAVRRRGPPLAA